MSNKSRFIILLLSSVVFKTTALGTVLSARDSAQRFLSLGNCSTDDISIRPEVSIDCSDSLLAQMKGAGLGVQVSGAIPTRRESVIYDVASLRISKETLTSLFRDARVQSIGGTANLTTYGKNIYFRYTPLHVGALAQVSNPALPYLDLVAFREDIWTVGFGYEIRPEISIGARLESFHRRTISVEADALDYIIRSDEDLFLTTETTEIAPSLSLRYKFINDETTLSTEWDHIGIKSSDQKFLKPLGESGRVGIGRVFHNTVGEFHLGLNTPFEGRFAAFETPSLATRLQISEMNLGLGISETSLRAGGGYTYDNMSSSIVWSIESTDSVFTSKRIHHVYINLSLYYR